MIQWLGGGVLGERLEALKRQWLLIAPYANPQMLEMFYDRDIPPWRDYLPWSGEFSGKYLTSLVLVCRLTGDAELIEHARWFVGKLLEGQAEDGYLGCFSKPYRITNRRSDRPGDDEKVWDTWAQYHNMYALINWYEFSGDARALEGAKKNADLLAARYAGDVSPKLVETGWCEMNQAPAHSLLKLYRLTGDERYRDFGRQLIDEFALPGGGDFFRAGLAGKKLYETELPRWESLHAVMALAEYYRVSGDARYLEAFANLWRSIRDCDRHNNGGFSSGEKATGNPYDPEPIETCCTIAWMEMSVEMLLLSGDSGVADELEWSMLNSVYGMHSPSGRWATYNTPSDGVRMASAHHINFQCRPGSPELNCCSVNSPKGYGLLSRWGVVEAGEASWRINFYGPGGWRLGEGVTLEVESDYPHDSRWSGRLRLKPGARVEELGFRIPAWSRHTVVRRNGADAGEIVPGQYWYGSGGWRDGDTVEIEFDFTPRIWKGERDCAGLVSLYRGPVLLAADRRFNRGLALPPPGAAYTPHELELPPLSGDWSLHPVPAGEWPDWIRPEQLWDVALADGRRLRLCDFASAGMTGRAYRSWLPVAGH